MFLICSDMTARPRRFYAGDAEDLLAAVRACRRAAVCALGKAPCEAEGTAVVRDLVDVLDRLAEALTGDRERFWTPLHTTPRRRSP
jgi:hypothetical protein